MNYLRAINSSCQHRHGSEQLCMNDKQRDRASSAILRGWVNLRLNSRLKGYISRQYLWTVRWGELLYYNFAAGSFHTKNFVADFIRLKLNFIKKREKSLF